MLYVPRLLTADQGTTVNHDHALRDAFRDRDHGIPSPLPDIYHERAAAVDVLPLVARPHPPLHLTGCFLLHPVGVRERHSCLGGHVGVLPGARTPYAMAHRSAWSFFFSLLQPSLTFVVARRWLGLASQRSSVGPC
jgi:hypothetical protein